MMLVPIASIRDIANLQTIGILVICGVLPVSLSLVANSQCEQA
jgi:hypothetical protein